MISLVSRQMRRRNNLQPLRSVDFFFRFAPIVDIDADPGLIVKDAGCRASQATCRV